MTSDSENNDDDNEIAKKWIQTFSTAFSNDPNAALDLFTPDTPNDPPFWRDMVAFSWNIATFEGSDSISDALKTVPTASTWRLSSTPTPLVRTPDGLEFWCDLETAAGVGKSHVRLDRDRRVRTLLTVLTDLKDVPFAVGEKRNRGCEHGPVRGRTYWSERQSHQRQGAADTFVVVIGGGQGGLAVGARLHLLGVPYIILESGEHPGWSWRNRYPSLHLHDPVWYNHMPFLPFPESWPVFCPKEKIADWLEMYAKVMDLHVQTCSRVTRATQLPDNTWKLEVQCKNEQGEIATATIQANHVVFATGNSSHPRIPSFPGIFHGLQIHSSSYKGGKPYKNKRVVVVGANNSAFDIVQDLWEQGAKSITMIQRTPSLVVSTESVLKHGLGPLYSQNAELHHEDADLVATTVPYKLALRKWKQVTTVMRQTDADLHHGLMEAGYQLDFGPDGTGIFAKSATEGGGFYINVGCAELLCRGDVSIKYAEVDKLEANDVVITHQNTKEKERIPADLIVYATGFDTMDQWVSEICGADVAASVGRTWGLGLGKRPKDPGPWEGELRNMWKPTTVEGLWFQGGNLAQCRHYSRFLGLQLAARYFGVDVQVYGIPEPTPPAE